MCPSFILIPDETHVERCGHTMHNTYGKVWLKQAQEIGGKVQSKHA